MDTTTDVIRVSDTAASKAVLLAEREGRTETVLRVRVTAGGCSGFSYKLTFEDGPVDGDHVVHGAGMRVIVDPVSAPILEGSTLEFDTAMLGGGFKMVNPRAKHECACGESFSL